MSQGGTRHVPSHCRARRLTRSALARRPPRGWSVARRRIALNSGSMHRRAPC